MIDKQERADDALSSLYQEIKGRVGIPGSVESSGFALRTREDGSPLEGGAP